MENSIYFMNCKFFQFRFANLIILCHIKDDVF